MPNRLAKLEKRVSTVEADLKSIKKDVKDIKKSISKIVDRQLAWSDKIIFGIIGSGITTVIGVIIHFITK